MPRHRRCAVGLALLVAAVAACEHSPITPSCSFAWAPTSLPVTASGGSFEAMVTTAATCSWSASADATWITLESARGTGPGAVTFRIAANTSASPRAAALQVQGQGLEIRQDASTQVVTCAFEVWPASVSFGTSGGAAPLAVTGPDGCRWTATTADTWLSLAGAAGDGAGPMIVSAAPNPSAMPRSGAVQIGGQRVSVAQAGVGCDFDVSPTSRSIGAAGGRFDISVATSANCDWQAASNVAWLSVSASRGTGSDRLTVDVAAFTGTAARTGSVRVAGETVTVTQAPAPAPCTFVVAPRNIAASAAGGSFAANVTTAAGCAWAAASNASWLTISSGQTGTGSGSIGLLVAANSATTSRTAVLQVGTETVTITQAGAAAVCTFAATPRSIAAPSAGGSFTVNVTTATGCAWTASSNAPWLAIASGQSGTGSSAISLVVAAHTSTASRTAVVQVGTETVTITQAGAAPPCTYSVTPSTQAVPFSGGRFQVTVSTAATCQWRVTSSVPWLTITAGAQGTGTGTVDYSVTTNTGQTIRTGTLSIASQTVTVSQAFR